MLNIIPSVQGLSPPPLSQTNKQACLKATSVHVGKVMHGCYVRVAIVAIVTVVITVRIYFIKTMQERHNNARQQAESFSIEL